MYIPLFNKSNYTLLSSLLKIEEIIYYAEKNKLPAISLVDTNMFGTMEFIKKCQTKNIKPIIGLELILDNYKFVLLAKDYIGYKCLIKLSTIQSERRIDISDLKKYRKNVIAIIPALYQNVYEELKELYVDIYLGFTNKKEENNSRIITDKVVFFQENLYLKENDSKILPYLFRIRDGKTISDDISYDVNNHNLEISNLEDFSTLEGLNNTEIIANECNLVFPEAKLLLPIYDCEDPKKYLFYAA